MLSVFFALKIILVIALPVWFVLVITFESA